MPRGTGAVELRPVRPDEIDLVVELHATTATEAYAGIYGGQPFPMERKARSTRRERSCSSGALARPYRGS